MSKGFLEKYKQKCLKGIEIREIMEHLLNITSFYFLLSKLIKMKLLVKLVMKI